MHTTQDISALTEEEDKIIQEMNEETEADSSNRLEEMEKENSGLIAFS